MADPHDAATRTPCSSEITTLTPDNRRNQHVPSLFLKGRGAATAAGWGLLLCAGCGTYGWTGGARAVGAAKGGEVPVVVAVVRAPGRSGVDVAAVTRAVIEGLGRAYEGPVRQDVTIAYGARVVCALDEAEAEGVGAQLVARVVMRCEVAREGVAEVVVRRRLVRQVTRGGRALLADETAEAVTVAAVALGAEIGPALARAVRGGSGGEAGALGASQEVRDVKGP